MVVIMRVQFVVFEEQVIFVGVVRVQFVIFEKKRSGFSFSRDWVAGRSDRGEQRLQ